MSTKLGERILARLKDQGMNQKELAEKVGLQPPHISRILNGKAGTTIENVKLLAEALGEPVVEYMRLAADLDPLVPDLTIDSIVNVCEGLGTHDKMLVLDIAETIRAFRSRPQYFEFDPDALIRAGGG